MSKPDCNDLHDTAYEIWCEKSPYDRDGEFRRCCFCGDWFYDPDEIHPSSCAYEKFRNAIEAFDEACDATDQPETGDE